jgi:hypothetical protein
LKSETVRNVIQEAEIEVKTSKLGLRHRPSKINDKDTNMDDARSFEADPQRSSPSGDVQASSGNHRIDIVFVRCGQGGTHYRVTYRGETLIESTKEPVLNACRALVAMGLRGRLEMWGGESYPRMVVHDIEQGAKLMVVEGAKTSPRIMRWSSHPNTAEHDPE